MTVWLLFSGLLSPGWAWWPVGSRSCIDLAGLGGLRAPTATLLWLLSPPPAPTQQTPAVLAVGFGAGSLTRHD